MNQLERDIAIAKRIKEIQTLYENLIDNVGAIKQLADTNKAQLSRILNLPKGDKGDRGEKGERGLTGKSGKDGIDGKDGYTPVKGSDYFTKNEEEALLLKTLARIKQPKDGETPMVDEDKIAEKAVALIREKRLLGIKDVDGVKEELGSYRHQMAMKQAGQHGGGDTVVAGTGIAITSNSDGTKTISTNGAPGSGTVTDVSVVSANGFTGSVATSTTTPAITLTTSVTGILKGNGTAMSAAGAGDVDSILPTQTGQGGKYLTTDGTNSSWATIAGGGNVSNTGTPLNNQIAVWTNATTIEGDADLTFDTTTNTLATGIFQSSTLTASEIVITDGSKNLVSAAVATYPSLTELTYLKGVTSSIQTQINAKGVGTVTSVGFTGGIISVATATSTPAFTVAGTSGGIVYFSSASTWATSAALAANAIVIGGGAGVAPSTTTTGTGVLTALGVNVGSAGAFVTFNGALGTPSSGTVTNLTGTASININGTVGATTPTTATFTTATINTVLNPDIDGGAGLGSATLGFSILGLSSGSTINFANSNVVLTHSSGILTVSTGDLRVTTAGTNTASVVTVGGTQTLTSKTLTSPVIGTIASNTLVLGTGTFTTLTFDAGASDPVITASSGVLTVSTGDLRVTTAGTNTASVVTVGGTQTLTAKTLTSPAITTATLSGAQLLAEGASIDLDPALSADGTYSGIAITGTAGATLAFGDVIYLAVADSRWELVDADSVTTCGAVLTGMCVLAAAADGNATKILLQGNIRADANFPALTVGANVYASTTPGDVTVTAPSATDDVVHVLGKALTADSMYFCPSQDYITIV